MCEGSFISIYSMFIVHLVFRVMAAILDIRGVFTASCVFVGTQLRSPRHCDPGIRHIYYMYYVLSV